MREIEQKINNSITICALQFFYMGQICFSNGLETISNGQKFNNVVNHGERNVHNHVLKLLILLLDSS